MNTSKHIWEGWTVQSFIDELEPIFDMIMNGESYIPKFTTKDEIKGWCMSNQPFYKKNIPMVTKYFVIKAEI